MIESPLLPLRFWKMHGCGNHFVVFELSRHHRELLTPELTQRICDPHFGVGADGIMAVITDDHPMDADFEVLMKNPDGTAMGMCGNGIRCVARYVADQHLASSPHLKFLVEGRVIETENRGEEIAVALGRYSFEPASIPMRSKEPVIGQPLRILDRTFIVTAVAIPNPHVVSFIEEPLSEADLERYGRTIENHPNFPARTNAEFVVVQSPREISVQVWERGAGATRACGTGASASVVAGSATGKLKSPCTVHLPGGTVKVRLSDDTSVVLIGPAVKIYEGEYL